MSKFNIGDKVICIDDENRELINGQIYTIFNIHISNNDEYIVLKELPKKRYWFHRFKKINNQLLPDDLFEI